VTEPERPRSAVELARQLGEEALADPADVPAEWFDLVEAVRDLVAATVATEVSAATRARVTAELGDLIEQLEAEQRDPPILLGRHSDGRLENLTQAGSGRLNPQAPRLVFAELPAGPAVVDEPVPVEVVATCRPTAAHLGPPDTVHGGVVAAMLDEVLGVAATAAGASGLTAGIDVRYQAATPSDIELTVRARFTHREGRKSFAAGEVIGDGVVTATATAVFIAPT